MVEGGYGNGYPADPEDSESTSDYTDSEYEEADEGRLETIYDDGLILKPSDDERPSDKSSTHKRDDER